MKRLYITLLLGCLLSLTSCNGEDGADNYASELYVLQQEIGIVEVRDEYYHKDYTENLNAPLSLAELEILQQHWQENSESIIRDILDKEATGLDSDNVASWFRWYASVELDYHLSVIGRVPPRLFDIYLSGFHQTFEYHLNNLEVAPDGSIRRRRLVNTPFEELKERYSHITWYPLYNMRPPTDEERERYKVDWITEHDNIIDWTDANGVSLDRFAAFNELKEKHNDITWYPVFRRIHGNFIDGIYVSGGVNYDIIDDWVDEDGISILRRDDISVPLDILDENGWICIAH